MTDPKLHHYVPRFYLRHFADQSARLWVYDKDAERVFCTTPNNIAAQTHFYRLPESMISKNDPLSIEKALSCLESAAAGIIARIIADVSALPAGARIPMSDEERVLLSEFMGAQHFRTLESRDLLLYLLEDTKLLDDGLSEDDKKAFLFQLLAESGFIEEFEDSVYRAIWMFARTDGRTPLITSDHPTCMKSSDNRMWIKGVGPLKDGNYVVFPLTPTLILYCHEATFWSGLRKFDSCVSPVTLDEKMVHHENCGQAFMASRFLISRSNDFGDVRDFIPSIGTQMYSGASCDEHRVHEVERTALFNTKRRIKPKAD